MSNWQRLDTKTVYQNHHLTIHEDNAITPAGKPVKYAWVESSPSVMVVAVDDAGKVLLIKQLRYTTGQPSWELPGGGTDGQDPLDAGKRELDEEAALHADKWVALSGEYYVWGGIATQRNAVLIARGLHKSKSPRPETDGAISATQAFSWAEIKEMIKNGELNDGETIAALMLAGLHLEHIK